ncbi:MAG TPA: type II 3-dehydroquinate dehydratase [Polyangiaceae bacterium]
MAARVKSAKPVKRATARVLVLSGPNLHRLGKRQPEIYGTQTLDDIHELLVAHAAKANCEVSCRQSNYEGELVEWIGDAKASGFAGLLLNPGALTHTSYALYDALLGAELPCVELHLSNPDAREAFRRKSTVAPACVGRVAGFGSSSYLLALDGLLGHLARQPR